ncbi:MAG: GTPase domain-containing protein [Pirellulaceae bacterium]|nr:GTPase domain-containing protein [Pirellulaceae bacterium]
MTTDQGSVSLESYRLAQYSVGVGCYICGESNHFDAELCRHCHAPMALARQANNRKAPPHLVGVLGAADAGKTVYLGMLTDMLSRQQGRLNLMARGAFSVSLQQTTMAALSSCQFPTKTPNEPDRWNWIHCQTTVGSRRRPLELIMPDVAGEALLEEIDHPKSYPVIRAFLGKCSGILLLVDVARLEQGEQDQDFVTMKVVTHLSELSRADKRGWGRRPVSIVFTKADQCDACFEDPTTYAQRHTPGLWQLCQARLQQFRFFASGVAGACACELDGGVERELPLRIEPRGIIEPFAWVIDNLAQNP